MVVIKYSADEEIKSSEKHSKVKTLIILHIQHFNLT
jgi:hypothetical protein